MATAIGFIGLGKMGAAIAERLESADTVLHVYDPIAENIAPFIRRGAQAHCSARDMADVCPTVFACLPTPAISLETARLVCDGRALRRYVEMSTIGRAALSEIADVMRARGVAVVDAPVSGGPTAARNGRLTIIAAAEPDAMRDIHPLLRRVAGTLYEVGASPGSAQLMKLMNNVLAAINFAAASEVIVLGTKAGLDPQAMIPVFNSSSGRNSATDWLIPQHVLTGRFDFGASIATMLKDVVLGQDEAAAAGITVPVISRVAESWRAAADHLGDDQDLTLLIKMLADAAHIKL